MRVRSLLRKSKTFESDTGWRTSDLQPRHAPIFARTRPIRAGWQWRSIRATGDSVHYILTALCNPRRGKWQVLLIVLGTAGPSVVARLEDHGSGLHAHAHCDRGGLEPGAVSLDDLLRVPSHQAYHRRVQAWTADGFVAASMRFFRVNPRPAETQLSLPL